MVIEMKNGRMICTVLTVVNIALAAVCAVLYLGTDREKPRFEFRVADIIYQEGMGNSALLEGITAYDNEDGDVTGSIVVEKLIENREGNSVVVFYAVSDKAGNVAKCSREFKAILEAVDGSGGTGMEVQEEWLMQSGFWAELGGNEGENGSGIEGEGSDEGNSDGENEDGLEGGVMPEEDALGDERGNAEGNRQGNTEERGQEASRADEAGTADEALQGDRAERGNGVAREDEAERENGGLREDGAETVREPERRGTAENGRGAGADSRGAAASEAPVLTLKVSEVKVSVGVKPAWVEVIGTLSDDKDGYETLFRNLDVSKYDVNQPGTYQVTVSTKDSDGNRSQAVPLTIVVK